MMFADDIVICRKREQVEEHLERQRVPLEVKEMKVSCNKAYMIKTQYRKVLKVIGFQVLRVNNPKFGPWDLPPCFFSVFSWISCCPSPGSGAFTQSDHENTWGLKTKIPHSLWRGRYTCRSNENDARPQRQAKKIHQCFEDTCTTRTSEKKQGIESDFVVSKFLNDAPQRWFSAWSTASDWVVDLRDLDCAALIQSYRNKDNLFGEQKTKMDSFSRPVPIIFWSILLRCDHPS